MAEFSQIEVATLALRFYRTQVRRKGNGPQILQLIAYTEACLFSTCHLSPFDLKPYNSNELENQEELNFQIFLEDFWASLVAQAIKNLSAVWESLDQFLDQEELEKRLATVFFGFHGDSAHKESICSAGNLGSNPGLERSLLYYCKISFEFLVNYVTHHFFFPFPKTDWS